MKTDRVLSILKSMLKLSPGPFQAEFTDFAGKDSKPQPTTTAYEEFKMIVTIR